MNRYLGMQLVVASAEQAKVVLPVRPEHVQEHGVVHGGLITTLADTAAVYLVHPELPEGGAMTSIDLHINFLRTARAGDGDLTAVATPVRIGRRVAVCRSEVRQGDRVIAVGTFTYFLFERER